MTSIRNIDAANVDLCFKKDDSIHISLEVKENGVDFDMTDYVVEMKVFSIDSSNALFRIFTSDDSLEVEVDSNGILTIQSDDPFTETGLYYFRVNVVDGDFIYTIIWGKLIVEN